jgi:membrane protein CcdC involved in cytochrome C biogenesis
LITAETEKMSRKVKRGISSLSFSINKLYYRISTLKPSSLVIGVGVMAIAVFLFGGGLYDIIVKPLPSYISGGTFLFLYPQLGEQFLSDSVIAIILYTLGIVGVVVIYQSTKYAYKPRQAYMMFMVGAVLVFVAYIFIETAIRIKASGG